MPLYPPPLKTNSKLAITAFSSGVKKEFHPRLDYVINDFKNLGFEMIEGKCLRRQINHASAHKEERAEELMAFLLDESIQAIAPPWGGEFAIEILPLLDFDAIKRKSPKWVFGFSDISAIATVLYAQCNWASAHCANLMDITSKQQDPLTAQTLKHLALSAGDSFTQNSSEKHQLNYLCFKDKVDATFNLTEKTEWKHLTKKENVSLKGRLIGGCIDILQHILGTSYLDLKAIKSRHGTQGTLLYLENAEMNLLDLKRSLLSLKFRGAFSNLNGLLLGRNTGPADSELTYAGVIQDVLSDLDCDVLYDLDIGHRPPHLTLINGAFAELTLRHPHTQNQVTQHLV